MDCGGVGCAPPPPSAHKLVNSRVMVVAVLVLFGVVLFIVCLHIYAKWFWRTHGSAAPRSADATVLRNTTRTTAPSVGLARAVVEALPTFSFSSSEKEPLECAVCLEDFEHGELGRTLPKCGHAFHLECIDMWFHSHSTCPLCRVSAGGEEEKEEKAEAIVEIPDEQPVVGDVAAPFMAAMRQQRRIRAQLASPNHSLPRTGEERAVEESAVAVDERVKAFETPLQVTIDVGSSNVASVLSPMARASASFRRLLSRGKSVVPPQEEADEGGSSSSPRAPSPRPPPSV